MAIAVALFIATIKGSLVACYFMHLISEKKLIYVVLGITTIQIHRADDPSGADAQQRLLDSRNESQVIPRPVDPPLRGPRGDVRSLVPGRVRPGGGAASLPMAVAAFAVALGLVVYDSWFLRKTRSLR